MSRHSKGRILRWLQGTGGVPWGADPDDYDPVAIEHIGGSFKTGKTKVGEFTLPAGTWLINSSAFFARTAAGPAGTRHQMFLFPGNRERIRWQAAQAALNMTRKALAEL